VLLHLAYLLRVVVERNYLAERETSERVVVEGGAGDSEELEPDQRALLRKQAFWQRGEVVVVRQVDGLEVFEALEKVVLEA
jgi:hypothetical protein